jgi:hypothetical protein
MIKKYFTDNLKKNLVYLPVFFIATLVALSANLCAMDPEFGKQQEKTNSPTKITDCYATKELGFTPKDYAEMPKKVCKKIIKAPNLEGLQKKRKNIQKLLQY